MSLTIHCPICPSFWQVSEWSRPLVVEHSFCPALRMEPVERFFTGKDRLCGEVDTNIGSAHWHVSKLQTVGWKTGFWHQLPNITFLKPEKVGFWYHKMGGHWPRNTADTLWNVWGRQVHCPELRGVERLPVAASFFGVGATLAMGQNEKTNHLQGESEIFWVLEYLRILYYTSIFWVLEYHTILYWVLEYLNI